MKKFIDPSVKIVDSDIGEHCRLYKDSTISNSRLGNEVSIGNDTNIVNCSLRNNVIINRRNFINNTNIDTFTYTGLNCVINYAKIGKFCSIARNVDIGGFDHSYDSVTTMPIFRLNNLLGEKVDTESEFSHICEIGNDVWIAAGVNILNKCKIGDGAIIGAGAVVTKDVEPYTIVTGIPAKTLKKRFDDKIIKELRALKWWDWPIEIINNNRDLLFNQKVTTEVIDVLKKIANRL